MKNIAGVDEVGRGPLAGPVVAAAVILPKEHNIIGLRDSKKLSKKKREELFPIILKKATAIGVGKVNVKTIDDINIRQATFNAMNMALERLPVIPDRALIDGHPLKDIIIPNEGIIGGDNKIESIMAASIIAKVTRDNIMEEYATIFHEYGFERHSGYGTKYHLDALKKHRATPIHRRSFNPVKKNMPTIRWLKENDKLDWMCEKLAALYLRSKGMTIIEMYDSGTDIIIIGKKEDEIVLAKVYSISTFDERLSETLMENIKADRLKKCYIDAKDAYAEYSNIRTDTLFVKLNNNKYPNIKHFRGIKLN